MDDKNQKTFSDLFSSINTDEKEDNFTFGDIFKDGVSDISSNLNEKNLDSSDKPEVETNTSFDGFVNSDIDNSKDVFSNDIFDDNISNNQDDAVTNVGEKVSDDTSESSNNSVDSSVNSIFFGEENVDSNKEEAAVDEKVSDNTSESSNNSVDSSVNTFFFGEENVDSNKEEAAVDEKVSEDTNESLDNSVDSSVNTFFFGEENADSDKEETVVDKIDNGALEKVEVDKSVTEDNKTSDSAVSESPFFAETNDVVSREENPLFLNTLNLVENVNQEKKVDVIDITKSRHFNVKIVKKKEPLIKVFIGVISYAIFIWLLFIGITLLIYVLDIKIRAFKGDYSSPTYNAYVVLTGSMLPDIQVYDVVVTKKIDASDLKVGDVITFASADTRFLNTTITHRIIKKNYDAETKSYAFQTKGDNNNVADSALVPQNNIYGKVILKVPKLGYLQEFLASDGGWIIVILIPCLAVISYDIVKLAKGLKKKKYKNIKVQK